MIARKSALIIIIQLINGLLGYIGLKFISYYMSPWEYGVIGFAYGFVSLFAIIGNLGFGKAHIKRISEGKNLGRSIGTYLSIKTLLAFLTFISTISLILIWRYVLGRGFESSYHEQAVYIILAYFILHIFTSIMTGTFVAKKEIAKAQFPLLAYNFVRIVLTVIVAYNRLGVLALAYTYLVGEIFNFLLALYLFRRYPIKKPTIQYIRSYYSFAIHMAVVVIAATIITNIDKVFIQLFWNAQQVGEYFAVYNLSRFVILFSGAVGSLLLPTISKYYSTNNIKEIKSLLLKSERYLSMIVFPIIIFMVVLAQPIIHILLSDKYLEATPILQILPFFVIVSVLSSPYQSKFEGINKPQIARNRVLLMMIFNVILNFILVPKDINSIGLNLVGLGATGAAIATVISYLVGFLYIRYASWKETGIWGSISILYHGFVATLVGFILYYINMIVYIDRWYHLVLISVGGFLLYIGILWALREFKKEDYLLFIDTLNIKKMIHYIKDELIKK